jgi:ABC-type histidine transport system ATPase subunit
MNLLEIDNLHVKAAGHEILKGIDLKVVAGEVHAIMDRTVPARARSHRCWLAARVMKLRMDKYCLTGRTCWR